MLFVFVVYSSIHVLLYILATWRVSHKRQNVLPFASTWVHPRFIGGARVVSRLSLRCLIMCLYVLSSMLWYPLRFPHKTMFGWCLPPVLCMSVHVLFTIFVLVCVYWCPTHIVLCVFSLRLCCQFLRIVHFRLTQSVFSNVYIKRK